MSSVVDGITPNDVMDRDDLEEKLLLDAGDGNVNKVKRLLDQGVPVNCSSQDLLDHTPLLEASIKGHVDMVKLLIQQEGINVNQTNMIGNAPLHYASRNGHTDVVKILLQHEWINVNLKNDRGDSPLHEASVEGHSDVVKVLLQHEGIDVNFSNNDGSSSLHEAFSPGYIVQILRQNDNIKINLANDALETPLHVACKMYDPSWQKRIDVCVTLIESGGDPQVKNKDGKTPLDILGSNLYHGGNNKCTPYELDSDDARPVKKALERRDYSLLLAEENVPITVVKLFLVGDSAVGKTTIKKSITTNTKQEQPHIPTPGIDVETFDIKDIGKLSIWDAAGHLEYHVTHGMFLGSQTAVAVVVYDLKKDDAYKQLQYWLRFLNSGQRASNATKLKIIVVATHLDKFNNKGQAFELAKKNLCEVRSFFGEILDISSEVHLVNSCDAQSDEMAMFKATIRDTTTIIKDTRMLPKLCEAILENKSSWVQPTSPVMSYQDYFAKVRELDPLVSPKLARITANYLQDMGEVFLAQSGDTLTHVVLDTKWLAYKITGPTLAGDAFVDQFKLLPPKTKYTEEELTRFYKGVADFPILSELLECLEIMTTFDGKNFIIPSKIPAGNEDYKPEFKKGRSVFSVDGRSMVSPVVFPTIQIRIMKSFGSQNNQPLVTTQSLHFAKQTVALQKELNGRDAINFAVEYTDGNAELRFDDLEKMTNIIVTTMFDLSPGTSIKTGYPSPQSLQQSTYLTSDDYYTMEDIELGEGRDGTVYNKSLKIREKTTDILIAGGDPHFLRKDGHNCDYQWMLQKSRREMFRLLDTKTCLKTDYRYLANVLQIGEEELATMEERCKESKTSITESILNHWQETSRQRMPMTVLYTMLKHPSLVGNAKAAKIVKDMMQNMGHQITLDYTAAANLFAKSGLTDIVLLWRAILRTTFYRTRERILPQIFAKKLLTDDSVEEVAAIESRDRKKAVDVLIEKLLEIQSPNWVRGFLDVLEEHYASLHAEIQKVRDEFESDELFASCRYKTSKVVTPKGDVLELPDFGVRLEIPSGALEKDELISVSIVASQDKYPPLEDRFVIAPIIRLEPDGIELQRPASLSIRHSAIDLKQQHLQIWSKVESSRTSDAPEEDTDWVKEYDGAINNPDILLTKKDVKTRRTHFCWLCFLGRCSLEVEILPFIEKDLHGEKHKSMTVFAVARHDAKVIEKEQATRRVLCCDKPVRSFTSTSCKDLLMSMEDVRDKDKELAWKPVSMKETISADDLQHGGGNAMRHFEFERMASTNSFLASLYVKQEGNKSKPKILLEYKMPRKDIGGSDAGSTISDIEILDVEDAISLPDMKQLCRYLRLSQVEIHDAEISVEGGDILGQKRAMLQAWRRKTGHEATKEKLLEALLRLPRNREAYENLKAMWHTM